MSSRMSPIQMLYVMIDIVYSRENDIDRKSEMAIEVAFERLLKLQRQDKKES